MFIHVTVKETDQSKWLHQLVGDVRNYLTGQPGAVHLKSKEYSLSLAEPMTYKLLVPKKRITSDQLRKVVVKTVYTILTKWLKFPTANQSRMQAAFIRTLLVHLNNPDILLLPGVYKTFQRVRQTLFP